ncbi:MULTISPECIES: hypothetical protein [unclassified Streptomyces]|uniref:hypothetical protein n=1 Tax=unclassified Streptomyces TaxID=2593676 RepID=UPI000DBA2A49|nr:hypothetical protein [Streptomyces sp. PsTaAH-137]MYT73861.1 hypothetical protein [Streptomyces sp. SID8367]RAJ89274.1 hypothetical protein K377_01399 [Streptomyces sp. PsTaAH-137]
MISGGEQDGSSVSDEEWERFQRESAEGVRDAPKEPSARARMVTWRLREEQGPPSGWREHRPPRRRKHWYVIGLLAALALIGVAVYPGPLKGWFGGDDPTDPTRATPAEPFRGSPAADWADGVAGLDLPEAAATGRMSKAQVARLLDRTRDFFVAANLDPDVLRGERPNSAIAYIDPRQDDMRTFLAKAFTKPGAKNDPTLLFSRFDPEKARLVGDVVKVRGTMTYEEAAGGGLEVHTDVTFVYPVTSADGNGQDVTRTIVRRDITVAWESATAQGAEPSVPPAPSTFSLRSFYEYATNAGCGTNTAYLDPDFGAHSDGGGEAVDPYDRSEPLDSSGGGNGECDTATRS